MVNTTQYSTGSLDLNSQDRCCKCSLLRATALYMYAIARMYAIVRLSVRRVDHTKMVEVRIMEFSPYGSPIPLVFAG